MSESVRAQSRLEKVASQEDSFHGGRFAAAFEQVAVGMAKLGLDGGFLSVNRKFCEIVGYSRNELLDSVAYMEIVCREDRDDHRQDFRTLLADGEDTCSVERRCVRSGGEVFWANITASLVRNDEERPAFFVIVVEDISERKRAEEALKESEELYRAVIEQAAEGIYLFDPEAMEILESNRALQEMLGYSAEELLGIPVYRLIVDERKSINANALRVILNDSYSFGERKYRRKDGSLVDVEVSGTRIFYGGKEAIYAVVRDVTERKEVEENLRQSLSVLLALREAGQILGSTLELEEIGSRLLEIMKNVSNLTTTVISVQEDNGQLRIWRSVGLESLWSGARFFPAAEEARRVAMEEEEPRLFRLKPPGASRSSVMGLCLPLRMRDHVFGVLEAYGPDSLAESDTMEVLRSITNQAASALENARLYGELAERERRLQELIGKLIVAQEEERHRVAYEVHDGLAQVAVAAHQHLQAFAERHPPEMDHARADLQVVLKLVRRTVSDARRIIANLRPTVLDDLGLAAALALEVEQMADEGYEVEYHEALGGERIPGPIEIAFFRVAQESLTNMRKHARTRWARIDLERRDHQARLVVRDAGRGFDPRSEFASSGPGERVGLAGMRERIGSLGGRLEIDARPGVGTSIIATVPLEA
ncbi:MAG TPA: PAS domain S-box protein [Rubrobacteraceae bacterium]|nr:PAS domain S-box protein [Rubrobacteraceae bacterium]